MPASLCGVVGLKPTLSLVSTQGVMPLCTTLDTVGPVTRTIRDNALVLEAIAGHDPRDGTSLQRSWRFTQGLDQGVEGLTVALPREYFGEGLAPAVREAVLAAAADADPAAEVVELRLDPLPEVDFSAALALVRPDRAIVMPAGTPPHKQASTTPAALRLQMCACFTALSPVVEVSDWEIRRGGRSYTVHTLEWLRSCDPAAELYLCVGSDMLLTFTQWYRWQDMLAMAALVVESREAGDEPALQAAAADLTAQGGRVLFARAEAYPCASSNIRSGKIPPEQWPEVLPPETLRVVQENHLYSAEKEV